jgi:hypothetical protein
MSHLSIFVLDVPEFRPLIAEAERRGDCRLTRFKDHYMRIESDGPVEFSRTALGMKPAVWYGLFTGGLDGRIERFDRDVVRIVPA